MGVTAALLFGSTQLAEAAGPVLVLSVDGQDATSVDVGVDANGGSVTVWHRSDGTNLRVQARRRSPQGVLGPIQTLSVVGKDAGYPHVAVAPDGDAIVSWILIGSGDVRLQTRRIAANGTLSAIRTITPVATTVYPMTVDINPAGDAVVTWVRIGANQAQMAVIKANNTVLSPNNLGGAGSTYADAAIDDAGNVVAAWVESDGANARLRTRRRTAAGSLTTIQYVSVAGQDVLGTLPDVAIEADGDAMIAWSRNDGTTYRAQGRRFTKTGSLGPISTLSAAGKVGVYTQVGVDSTGNAVFTWMLDQTFDRIQARRRTLGGGLSAIQTITPSDVSALLPAIAVDSAGNAAITWLLGDSSSGVPQVRVWRTSGMGSTQSLRSSGTYSLTNLLDVRAIPVAVSASGKAAAAWSRDDGTGDYRAEVTVFTTP